MNRPTVVGEPAHQRLMRSIDVRRFDEPAPTPNQVAMVLHALADHTAILEMLKYDPDTDSPLEPIEATSVGRWFHAVGDDLESLDPSMKEYTLTLATSSVTQTIGVPLLPSEVELFNRIMIAIEKQNGSIHVMVTEKKS